MALPDTGRTCFVLTTMSPEGSQSQLRCVSVLPTIDWDRGV
ncbi:MAG: hypothetical protein ACR2LA_07150 [Acidimicrobiales bacterium]